MARARPLPLSAWSSGQEVTQQKVAPVEQETIDLSRSLYQARPVDPVEDEVDDHQVEHPVRRHRVDPSGRAILVSVIDNLLKGASGQAVQNMNVMLGLDERMALL